MNRFEFFIWAYKTIKQVLPKLYEAAEVDIHTVVKTGMSYTAMTVKCEGQIMCPAINLDEMFDSYLENEPLPVIAARMASIIQTEKPGYDISFFEHYEMIRERLFIRVCNYEANKELLSGVPHEKIEDLAITYHAMVDISEDGEFASAIINNSMMEAFRISHRQLREDAMASSPHVAPAKVEPLQNVVGELLDANMDDVDDPKQDVSMIVVTNIYGINGASVLFYPGMMDKLADEMHGSFYVLPSSIHEVIVIPASLETDGERLNAMIREINARCVHPADKLSDNAYLYDVDNKTLRMIGG